MKLSKLIAKLEKIEAKHGDLECTLDEAPMKVSQVKILKDVLFKNKKFHHKIVDFNPGANSADNQPE